MCVKVVDFSFKKKKITFTAFLWQTKVEVLQDYENSGTSYFVRIFVNCFTYLNKCRSILL